MSKCFSLVPASYVVRGMAHDPRFHAKSTLATALEQAISTAKLSLAGYVGHGDRIQDMPLGGMADLIPDEPQSLIQLAIAGGDISISWLTERDLIHRWIANLYITISISHCDDLESAAKVLKSFVTECSLFWGEANEIAITGKFSFASPNAHYLEVPRPGSINYFGREYVEYFGGRSQFTSAPHVAALDFNGGILTELQDCHSHDEFKQRQAALVAHLGEDLFRVPSSGVPIHRQLFWGEKRTSVQDPELFERLFGSDSFLEMPDTPKWSSTEQEHAFRVAVKSGLKALFATGNLLPTAFVHEGDQLRYFTFGIGPIEKLRHVARSTIATKCHSPLAYAFAYDGTLDQDGEELDALFIEIGTPSSANGALIVVRYNRATQEYDDPEVLESLPSLLS